jgi:hypothetical protein
MKFGFNTFTPPQDYSGCNSYHFNSSIKKSETKVKRLMMHFGNRQDKKRAMGKNFYILM